MDRLKSSKSSNRRNREGGAEDAVEHLPVSSVNKLQTTQQARADPGESVRVVFTH